MSRGTVCGLELFLKFWIVLDFLQKTSAWFSKFYLRVQSKNCGRKHFFLFFFVRIFLDSEQRFLRPLAKKLQKVVKTTFCVCRGTICGLKVFLKVLNRFGFPAETFGMVLTFYLRVQSKICRRKFFFYFSLQTFFGFWAEIFQTSGQKTSRSCQNYLLRVQTNNFWFKKLFKSFEAFGIFCKNLWRGSWISIYVSRVKFAEEITFLIFLFRNFSDFEQKFFKTTFCLSRGTILGLKNF